MNIRLATLRDLDSCGKLGRISEFELPSGGHLDKTFLENYLGDLFLVVEYNGNVIGYAIGEPLVGKVTLLWFMTIKEKFRGRGLGEKLVKEFEGKCKKLGMEWIILYAPTFNERSVNFYKKQNYNIGKTFFECNKALI